MIATIDTRKSGRWLSILALVVTLGVAGPALAQDPPAHDLLNAVLWMQRSVEYKAHALGAFALARIRLESHAEQLDAGAEPTNVVAPASLPPLTRAQLREAFRAIAHAQKRLSVYVPLGL